MDKVQTTPRSSVSHTPAPAHGPILKTNQLNVRRRIRGPIVLLCSILAGCASPAAGLPPLPPTKTGHYVLGPSDTVRIITFDAKQMTGNFKVGNSGDIDVPLLGEIHAEGLTVHQLQQKMTADLMRTGMFKQPSVAVEVATYRPIFILGEVKKPGRYAYEPGMTVLTAAAIAGGFTYRANENVFSVVRNVDRKAIEGRATRQTLLQPGDVVDVYERHF